jgi:hypothetical protein
MFSRSMSAIYSGAFWNPPSCLKQTPLRGIDHVMSIRAITDIWFPRARKSEKPLTVKGSCSFSRLPNRE